MLTHPPLIPNSNHWVFPEVLAGIANDYKCQRIKYFGDFYVSFFDIFLLVGKKRGDGFYVGFQKMVNVYFMYHPSGWDIKYTFSLYY